MPTLNLIATEVDSVGRPTSGKKQGARLIWTDDLRDKATGQDMGQHSGDCVLVREPSSPANSGSWFCRAGWNLPAGNTLVAGGVIDFDATALPTVAIFGGTGAYKDARGEISVTSYPGQAQTEYTLEILP
jgi:hypothetical protein